MSADLVLLELNARWNCALPFGWVPVTGPAEKSEQLEIYDLKQFVGWFGDDIKSVIANTFGTHFVHEVEEGGEVELIALDECVLDYRGLEYMYTDTSFRFLLYFSHESSVTVGSKVLIEAIQQAWPAYKKHLWHPDATQ